MSKQQSRFNASSGTRRLAHKRLPILGAAVAALGVTGMAMGDNISWVGPVGVPAPFEVGANWTGGNVPGPSDLAFINNGGVASISTFSGSLVALSLGSDASTSGGVIQDGGSLALDTNVAIAGHVAGTGSYTLNSGAINSTAFFVGANGSGSLNVGGGTITVGGNLIVANGEGSNGVLTMTGGVVSAGNFLLIGHFSPAGSPNITTGTLNVSGGTLTGANFNIGQHPNARGEVHQSGGFINNTANMVVGEISRQQNQYHLSGGTLRISGGPGGGSAFLGSSNGIGEMHVSGTGNAQIDGHIFAGSGTNSLGTFSMSGGTVALGLNKPEGGFLVAGEFGQATATISGGNFSSDFYQMGRRFNTTSRGQTTQTGGSVTVRRAMNIGGLSGNDNFYAISSGALNLTNELGGGTNTFGETLPGIHVARFSVDPGSVTPVTEYSRGRFTVSGSAAVNIAGGLYNSTGFTPTAGANAGVPLPGGAGIIEVTGGSLTAGSFLNGGAANAGSYNNGGASANYTQSGGVASLGHVTGTGDVNISGGTMTVSSLRQSSATINGGVVRVAPDGTAAATSVVNSLTVSGSGVLDVTNNALVVDYSGASPLSTIRGYIVSGYSGGSWTGPGINSSTAAGGSTHGIGYAEASSLTTVPDIFGTVDADAVLARFTRYGDATLDGLVNVSDFNRLAANFNLAAGAVWGQGDFNYDGRVNITDFNLLAANFNLTASPDGPTPGDWATLAAAVPEPSSLLVLGAAGTFLAARRRRNNSR